MGTNMELSRVGGRRGCLKWREIYGVEEPGGKVSPKAPARGGRRKKTSTDRHHPPYQNASGLHSNRSSKSASERAGISREEDRCVWWVGGRAGSWEEEPVQVPGENKGSWERDFKAPHFPTSASPELTVNPNLLRFRRGLPTHTTIFTLLPKGHTQQ